MKLSPTQIEVVAKMSHQISSTVYQLDCSLATLNALVSKGVATAKHERGSMFMPHNCIKYTLTKSKEEFLKK